MALTLASESAISESCDFFLHLCFNNLTQNLQNESESDRQRRDDGPSAPSPAPPSPDKNELKSRLQALEATLQTKALENSALKRDNASLSQQVADMGTRLETLETALQDEREMVKSEKKQGRDRLRVHQEASYRAAAKKEVSAMHLNAMCYLSRSIDMSFHYHKTKFNRQIKSERKELARISAAKFLQGRELNKKITLLEEEVNDLRFRENLGRDEIEHEIDSAVSKAVTAARQSERRHTFTKNKRLIPKLTEKASVAQQESKVS